MASTPGLFFEGFGVGGEYTLSGDKLTVVQRGDEAYRRKYPQVKELTFTGTGVPATVPGGAFILGWALGRRTQTCDTQWDAKTKTLTIVGNDFYENTALITATRN
jgi:hypothetical protein